MNMGIKAMQKEIQEMRDELHLMKHIIAEEYELSDEARLEIDAARQRMKKGDFVPHETVMKRYG